MVLLQECVQQRRLSAAKEPSDYLQDTQFSHTFLMSLSHSQITFIEAKHFVLVRTVTGILLSITSPSTSTYSSVALQHIRRSAL